MHISIAFLTVWLVVENHWELRDPLKMLLISFMSILPILECCRWLGIDQALEHRHILLMNFLANIPSLGGTLIREMTKFLYNLLMLRDRFNAVEFVLQIFKFSEAALVLNNIEWSGNFLRAV